MCAHAPCEISPARLRPAIGQALKHRRLFVAVPHLSLELVSACIRKHGEDGRMKRREIKFVAGSLQLAPDRIASSLRRPAAGRRGASGRAPIQRKTAGLARPCARDIDARCSAISRSRCERTPAQQLPGERNAHAPPHSIHSVHPGGVRPTPDALRCGRRPAEGGAAPSATPGAGRGRAWARFHRRLLLRPVLRTLSVVAPAYPGEAHTNAAIR
jgi:hypothetical protein